LIRRPCTMCQFAATSVHLFTRTNKVERTVDTTRPRPRPRLPLLHGDRTVDWQVVQCHCQSTRPILIRSCFHLVQVNATAAVKHGSAGVHSLQAVGQCMTAGCRRRWTTVDLSVFRSAVFNYFCLHTMMLYVSYDIPYIYGPVRAVGHGMSPSSASFLVSIIGISTTVGQVRAITHSQPASYAF